MAINFVEQIDDVVRVQHVLVSVSEKAGLEVFIPELVRINPSLTLYSTGGTFQALQKCLGTAWPKSIWCKFPTIPASRRCRAGWSKRWTSKSTWAC